MVGKTMPKKCLSNNACPLIRGYDAIGDWWSLVIVSRVMFAGGSRFGEIQESLGVARNILTARLKKLVAEGILEKVPASDGSAYHEYVLTEKGRGLFKVIVALREWGERYARTPAGCGGAAAAAVVDAATGKPIRGVEVRSADGRALGPEDLRVAPVAAAADDTRPAT